MIKVTPKIDLVFKKLFGVEENKDLLISLINSNLPPALNEPSLKKALNVLEQMNFSEIEQEAYENRLKWLRTEESALKKTKQDGLEEGIQQGI